MGLRDKLLKTVARAAEEYNKAGEKVDAAKEVVKGTAGIVKDTAKVAAGLAGEKAVEIKKENEKKPSTGSSILDAFLPTVPHTEVTKSKAEKAADKAKGSKPAQP